MCSVSATDSKDCTFLNNSSDDGNIINDYQNESVEINEDNNEYDFCQNENYEVSNDNDENNCQKFNDKLSLSHKVGESNLLLSDDHNILAASTSTKIVVSSTTVIYGDSLSVRLLTSANKVVSGKTIKITINGKSYSKTTNSNGYVYLPLNLAAKNYSTSIVFAGSSGYTKSSKTVTITVTKRSTAINVNNVNMVYGDGSSLTTYLYDNKNTPIKGKTIDLMVGNVNYGSGITNENGKSTIKINMDPGKYTPVLKFNGDNYYSGSSQSCNVQILGNYSKAISFGLDDIETSASEVKKYIENYHCLPDNVLILGYNVTKEQYLDLFANSLINVINGDNISKVFLGNYSNVISNENVDEISLTKSQYTFLINSILSQTGKGVAPKYITFNGKNIGFESLIYLCSKILDSYQLFNSLPDKIDLIPWSVISNNNTSLVTMEEVFKTSENIVKYIESKHSLPGSIYINTASDDLISINWAQFLKLELDTFMNFNNNCFVSIVVKSYENAVAPSETITGGTLNNTAYTTAAVNVLNFMNNNGRAPNYATTIRGSIGFESLIYIYSEILVSINQYFTAPNEINLVPWTMVIDNKNIFISMNNVSYMAGLLKKNVRENHIFPSSLSCDGRVFTIPQFLNLELGSIKNINSNLFQSLLLKSYNGASDPSESLSRGKFSKDYYLNMVDNIKSFLVNNNRAPNYVTTSYGQMRYENYISMFAEIIEYAGRYNKLPTYAMFNQWSVVSSSNCIIFNEYDILEASHSFVSYVEFNHSIPNSIKVGAKNLNKNQFLYLLVTLVHKINGTYSGDLILDSYSSASVSETLTSGILDKNSYLDVARLIGYDMGYNDHIDETTYLGKISTNSALYIYSQILSSYDNTNVLPDFVNVKPWSIISNSNTKFYTLSDIINSSSNLKNYIDKNNILPDSILIAGNSISISNVLKLFANAVTMIEGNLISNIAFENYGGPDSSSENIIGKNLDNNEYINIALQVMTIMDNNKKVPNYFSTEIGNVRYESLINLYSNVLHYFKLNNVLIDNIVILPWSKINSKIFTIDEISNASFVLKDYIERNHELPNNLIVGGINLNLIQYLQVASEAILNLNSNMYSSISYRDYSSSINSCENLENSFDIYLLEYISLIEYLNEYIDENHKVPDYLIYEINYNEIHLGINSFTYFVSEILSSYNICRSLPEFLTYVSWNVVSNSSNIFLSHESIINSTNILHNYVNNYHALPQSIVIDGIEVNMVQLMDLYSSCIYNINFNIYQDILLDNFDNLYNSYENIICGDLEFYEYISLVCSLKELFDDNIIVSNLSDLSLGDNIGFNTLLMMESFILGNYSRENINKVSTKSSIASFSNDDSLYGLPEEVSIVPWIVVSNPEKVYNFRNGKVFDSIQDAIDDNDTLNQDYIGIAKQKNFENININKSIYLSNVGEYTVNIYGNGILMKMLSDNTVIDGLNFIGGDVGIYINASSCKLTNCIFNSTNNGIIMQMYDNYIGFCEFNNVNIGISITGNRTTVESNKINFCGNSGINVNNAYDVCVIGNIINGENHAIYVNNSRADVTFNSIISDKGVFIDSVYFVNLSDNWWGLNAPNFDNCILNGNVSYDSWLTLNLKYFTDWSSECRGTRNIYVIADLKHNNLGHDLSRIYTLDNVNITFSSDYGEIKNYELTDGGYAKVIVNASNFGVAHITVTLNNQVSSCIINLYSNMSYGVYNNRSGKYFYNIQDAIEDNDTISGDIIVLKSGFYTENIFIYKDITLVGEDDVYINPLIDSKATVTIFGFNISICNLCISGFEESYAVTALGTNISFNNCNFTDAMVGLYLMGCTDISVINCNFLDNVYGSYNSYTKNLLFNNSKFIEDSYGINALYDVDLIVDSCIFDDCWIGIDLNYCNFTSVHKSNISSSYLGLELINSNDTYSSENLFMDNIIGYSTYNSSITVYLNSFKDNILGDFGSFDNPNIVLQKDMWSCGPASLTTILNQLGYSNFNQEMIINATNINNNGTSLFGLYKFLKDNGFTNTKVLKINSSNIMLLDLVLLNISGDYHFSVVWNFTNEWIVLADSTAGLLNITWSSFNKLFSNIILTVNGTNRLGFIISNQEMAKIYGTYVWDDAWAWMNSPAYTIQGYKDLDKNYGLLGSLVKFVCTYGFGVQEDGTITKLDLALDILSVVSCVGTVGRVSTTLSRFSKSISNSKFIDSGDKIMKGLNKLDDVLSWVGDPKGSAIKYLSSISSIDVKSTVYKKISIEMAEGAIYGIHSFSSRTIEIAIKHNKYIKKYFSNNFRAIGDMFKDDTWNNLPNSITKTIDKVKRWGGATVKNIFTSSFGSTKINKKVGTKSIKGFFSINKFISKNKHNKNTKIFKKSVKLIKKTIKSSKYYKPIKKTYNYVKKAIKSTKIYKTISKSRGMKYIKGVVKGLTHCIKKYKFW